MCSLLSNILVVQFNYDPGHCKLTERFDKPDLELLAALVVSLLSHLLCLKEHSCVTWESSISPVSVHLFLYLVYIL